MKAKESKLDDLLSNVDTKFTVPIFQRKYSWDEEQCHTLWKDLQKLGETSANSGHFIGSIVCYQLNDINMPGTIQEKILIDGQQRLTTLSILMIALSRAYEKLGEITSAEDIKNRFIFNNRYQGEDKFKLVPTTDDKETYFYIAKGIEKELIHPSEQLLNNFNYFVDLIPNTIDELNKIYMAIIKLDIVYVVLTKNQDNPQIIFESMNSTGKGLSQGDLLRNYLLLDLDADIQKKLYDNYWRPIEQDFGQQGYVERFDFFLRDYLIMTEKKNNIRLDRAYEEFKNYYEEKDFSKEEVLVFLCGHYEGVDERFIEACVDEELSIGDFVLTGGELGAMVVTDCVCRMVPGVLSDTECYTGESHWAGRLEYPQYTRPETWEGRTVPEVLRGGNHAEIEAWRTRQSLERTLVKRPELFRETPPTPAEQRLLDKIRRDRSRPQLTQPPVCRAAAEDDLPAILAIAQQARNYLRRHRVDQWQGAYPNADTFRADIAAGTCHVLTYQGAVAAMFTLSCTPDPAYDALTDGRWRSDRDHAAVLHRNAVAADWRGTGMADHLMQAAEQLARESGAHAVRVDTHRHNGAQKKLLERHGYRFCGNILCDEPGHDPRRQAFEKLLR